MESPRQAHLAPVEGWGCSGGLSQQIEGVFVVLVSQLHLRIFAPHTGQVVHILEGHSCGLVEDDAGIVQAVVTLVEPGKGTPQSERLANSLQSSLSHLP